MLKTEREGKKARHNDKFKLLCFFPCLDLCSANESSLATHSLANLQEIPGIMRVKYVPEIIMIHPRATIVFALFQAL